MALFVCLSVCGSIYVYRCRALLVTGCTHLPMRITLQFNHHEQVISGLKNMDLFLLIDLPKVEDIQHVPPPFPDHNHWASPHRTNRNQHVYYSALSFGKNNHGPMTELNTNTSEYLAEAIHITVCNQYKKKYTKLLERIAMIKQNTGRARLIQTQLIRRST